MVAILIYAYCIGERSSRRIERRCTEDIAFRVLAANQVPDHATIDRFVASNEAWFGNGFEMTLLSPLISLPSGRRTRRRSSAEVPETSPCRTMASARLSAR